MNPLKTNDKTVSAIAPGENEKPGEVKEDKNSTEYSITQNLLNPLVVAVDYTVACDLETELECAVFEDEDEEDDERVLNEFGEAVRRGTNEVPQQFYQELRKRTETRKTFPVKGVCPIHYEEFKKSGIPDEVIKSTLISLSPEGVRGHLGWRGSEDQPAGQP